MPWHSRRVAGSSESHQARVPHQLVVEAEIHQVQDRVFDAADVLVDRQPVIGPLVQLAIGVRAAVAGVVPGGFHEGVEGVGFALGGGAALRAASSGAIPGPP